MAQDYQYKEILSMPSWLVRLWQQIRQFFGHWISVLLAELARSLKKSGPAGRMLVIGLVVFLLASLAVLAYWQYKGWKKNFWKAKAGTTGGENINQLYTAAQWRQKALSLKDEGNFADACRILHRACLQLLDEAHILAFVPARSNYEYVMALSSKSSLKSLKSLFQSFSNLVDSIYFGNRPAGEADFQFCSKLLQEIQEMLNGIVDAL